MNRIMTELSLTIASLNYEITLPTEHIPGVLNVWADALSRLAEPEAGKQIPPELAALRAISPSSRDSTWWISDGDMAPPSELRLWRMTSSPDGQPE